jgi:hypothetical protein
MEIQGCRKTADGSCQSLDLLTSSTAVTPELLNLLKLLNSYENVFLQ